jgi:hypothetical protein
MTTTFIVILQCNHPVTEGLFCITVETVAMTTTFIITLQCNHSDTEGLLCITVAMTTTFIIILQCKHSDTKGLLCITVDTVAMTTTCIGSQKGVDFLNHNVQKLDVTADTTIKSLLVQFLSGKLIYILKLGRELLKYLK